MSCGHAVTQPQQPTQSQQPIYQQPQYAPPAHVKKKSSAPLIIISIAGLCVIAFVAVAISTNFFGISDGRGDSGDSSRTNRPISSETPAHGTDGSGQAATPTYSPTINGTISEWPGIIPFYDDGDATIDVCGGVTGISILNTRELYFIEYLYDFIDLGWEWEEAAGTDDLFFAWKDDVMASLFYGNGITAIMFCQVVD
jgi:hypothetical protein